MKIIGRHIITTKLFIFSISCLLASALLPDSVSAGQTIFNGNLTRGLDHWKSKEIIKGIYAGWGRAGYKDNGSLVFKSTGRRVKGERQVSQHAIFPAKAGSRGKIEFAWKKNWLTAKPIKQNLYVNLVKPDGATVAVWENAALLNDNAWNLQSIDVSGYLDISGYYTVVCGASLESGNDRNAAALAWLDNVSLDILMDSTDHPSTSILTPTGLRGLTGKQVAIRGLSAGKIEIDKVELAITRLSDNAYWNGDSWLKAEFWSPAKLISDREKRSVGWEYYWVLPTADKYRYKIMARSSDTLGNRDSPSAEVQVEVDNIAPSGNIYIENAAIYTNKRRVLINNDVRGAAQMRFSQDNGKTWTAWAGFATSATLLLPGKNGVKIVSAQFKDDYQNVYQTSDSIIFDITPPVARFVFPSPEATKVAANSKIGVVFYENMNPRSFENNGAEESSSIFIKQESNWIDAQVSYDTKTKTARIAPKQELQPGTTYTVHLKRGIKDIAQNSLAADYSWKFTTAGSRKLAIKAILGNAGGKLGGDNQQVTLSIPHGSLSKNTQIAIDELRGNEIPGLNEAARHSPVFRVSFDPRQFHAPATLKIKYKAASGLDPSDLVLSFYDDRERKWRPADNFRINPADSSAISQISSPAIFAIIKQNDFTAPSTAIMGPVVSLIPDGAPLKAYGYTTDNSAIYRVEISIKRLSDGYFFSNGRWQKPEAWLQAKLSVGKGKKYATWSLTWTPSEITDTFYLVKARSVDNSGNIETNPAMTRVKFKE